MGVPEGEDREKGIKNLSVKMRVNFPKLMNRQLEEAQRVPDKTNLKRPTPRPFIIKMQRCPGLVAQLVRVSSPYAKVVGLMPGQGTYKNQPVCV